MRSTSRSPRRDREDLSLVEVLYILWSRRTLVAGAALVLLAGAMLFSFSREPVYTAEAEISVVPLQQGMSQSEREDFIEDVVGVVADDALLDEVVAEVGWRGGVEDFRERLEPVSFVDQDGSTGVRVGFSAATPEQASEAANAYSTLFVERVERLGERRLAGGTLAADASVESEAAPPDFRASPRPLLYGLVAVVCGIVVGGGVALLLEGRASNWRDARDAEMTLRVPVVGVIPDYSAFEEEQR